MTERTTVRLPEDLLRRAKRKAASEGRTLTSLIADGLRLMLADNRSLSRTKRVLPRTSSARGGLLPGLDWTDLHLSDEADDIDYVQGLKRPE